MTFSLSSLHRFQRNAVMAALTLGAVALTTQAHAFTEPASTFLKISKRLADGEQTTYYYRTAPVATATAVQDTRASVAQNTQPLEPALVSLEVSPQRMVVASIAPLDMPIPSAHKAPVKVAKKKVAPTPVERSNNASKAVKAVEPTTVASVSEELAPAALFNVKPVSQAPSITAYMAQSIQSLAQQDKTPLLRFPLTAKALEVEVFSASAAKEMERKTPINKDNWKQKLDNGQASAADLLAYAQKALVADNK